MIRATLTVLLVLANVSQAIEWKESNCRQCKSKLSEGYYYCNYANYEGYCCANSTNYNCVEDNSESRSISCTNRMRNEHLYEMHCLLDSDYTDVC